MTRERRGFDVFRGTKLGDSLLSLSLSLSSTLINAAFIAPPAAARASAKKPDSSGGTALGRAARALIFCAAPGVFGGNRL